MLMQKGIIEDGPGSPQSQGDPRREWIDPIRLYDPRIPAGRLVFFWGLAIFPPVVIFVLLSVIITLLETITPKINPDYIGIIVWPFMLAWVMATVAITHRRLLQLQLSQRWVWVAILPIVNLPLFLYLLVKSGAVGNNRVA
jgi:uncharacterized membrane protein YhaH (DUF805 family)